MIHKFLINLIGYMLYNKVVFRDGVISLNQFKILY